MKRVLLILLVVAVALVDVDGRVLLAQRPEGKPLAGLWEFPGGKVHEGENPEYALVRELRGLDHYKGVPMLMLTTESGTETKQRGKQAGATGWIVKPFNPEQLLATIARVL